ncbi:MAG: hypothetical protein NVSMB67_31330 [Flavisolibacter sp.]
MESQRCLVSIRTPWIDTSLPKSGAIINLCSLGILSQDYSAEQNSSNLNSFINAYPPGSAASLYVPSGAYQMAREIRFEGRPMHFFGDNGTVWGNGTQFYFPKESMGIVLLRRAAGGSNNYQEGIIENIALIGKGNKNPWMDGIVIRSRVTLRGVYVRGFYNGIEASCNIDEGNDCSGSYIEKCFMAENTNDGFYVQGTDANAITILSCDARDNGSWGFYDRSFLGNSFIACMAHNNKAGHYGVGDKNNARVALIACYGEMGVPPDDLSPLTTVVGGFHANGYNKNEGKTVPK